MSAYGIQIGHVESTNHHVEGNTIDYGYFGGIFVGVDEDQP